MYDFASVMMMLPSTEAEEVRTWSLMNIPDSVVYVNPGDPTYGRRDDSHLTLSWGFKDEEISQIQSKVSGFGSVTLEMGQLIAFRCGIKKGIVALCISFEKTPQLQSLFEMTSPSEKRKKPFKPHCTIAYVTKEFADKLRSDSKTKEHFVGKTVTFDSVHFGRTDGTRQPLSLLACTN